MNSVSAWLAISAALVAMLLSGCAQSAPPLPVSTPEPISTPSVEPVVAKPGSRVPVTCDGLVAALVDSVIFGAGTTGEDVLVEEESVYTTAIEQSGFRGCNFTGFDGKSTLHFWIVPDGEKMLGDRAERYPGRPEPTAGLGGPDIRCDGDAERGFGCSINAITAKGYWLDGYFRLYTQAKSADSLAEIEAGMADAVAGLVEEIDGAGAPLPEWSQLVTLTNSGGCGSWKPGNVVAQAVGATSVQGPLEMDSGDGSTALYMALDGVGYLGCGWSSPSDVDLYVYVDVLPGGDWAWDGFVADAGSPIPVAGADEAVLDCGDGQCTISARARGSLVSLSIQVSGRYDQDDGIAALEALIPTLPLAGA